jgi:hypothetical protein
MDSVLERFNSIRWHDSKLLGIAIYRTDGEDKIKLSFQLYEDGGTLKAVEMVFRQTTYVEVRVDLEGKRVCADDISGAECSVSSEWTTELSKQNPHDNFDEYLHFAIYLIPPGGKVDILAKDYFIQSPLLA